MAIVSRRPQSTRTRISGIRHLPNAQIVFMDTLASIRLGRRQLMQRTAERAPYDVVPAAMYCAS